MFSSGMCITSIRGRDIGNSHTQPGRCCYIHTFQPYTKPPGLLRKAQFWRGAPTPAEPQQPSGI